MHRLISAFTKLCVSHGEKHNPSVSDIQSLQCSNSWPLCTANLYNFHFHLSSIITLVLNFNASSNCIYTGRYRIIISRWWKQNFNCFKQFLTWSVSKNFKDLERYIQDFAKVLQTLAELEIAVSLWPFSDQFSPYGQANPICYAKFTVDFHWENHW